MHNLKSGHCFRRLYIKRTVYTNLLALRTIASLWSPSTATFFSGLSTISGDNILAFVRLFSILLNCLSDIQSVLIVKKNSSYRTLNLMQLLGFPMSIKVLKGLESGNVVYWDTVECIYKFRQNTTFSHKTSKTFPSLSLKYLCVATHSI